VVLIILDGFGVNPGKQNNPVLAAHTPRLDHYFSHFPHTTLQASGNAVGVPDGQMGNSEIGHMTLGCGAIIRQDITRIDAAIAQGDFFQNPAFIDALLRAKLTERPLHLLGLVSDGGVHSALNHLQALLTLCRRYGVRPLLHMVSDGRDTPPKSALGFLHQIEPKLHEAGGAIATVMGRYYAMDRDNRWDRSELAWRAIVHGKGQQMHTAETALRSAYAAGDYDEFIRPAVLPTWQPVQESDPLISFNFRKDRPRQIIRALGSKTFEGFDRGDAPLFRVTTMMPYDNSNEMPAAYQAERPLVTLAGILSELGLRQFHCAETEKYPHVTYFFNGGRFDPFIGETQKLIPSPNVATYDLKPCMSADKVADAVVEAINENSYDFILVNFANGDMVGHTAKPDAVIEAIETLDREAGRVLDAAVAQGYSVMLTADHGNCEELIDPVSGAPHTQHTLYPVPCLIVDEEAWQLSCHGGLANVAPTLLQLMGLEKPREMSARSLLLKSLGKSLPATILQGAA